MKTIFKSRMMMKSFILIALMPFMAGLNAFGNSSASGLTTTEAILKAQKNGNAVFLVITDSTKTDYDKAKTIADAANASVKKSVVITLDRDDASNALLVAKYNIASAPLPLLVVISPKGVLAGGYLLAAATADLLIAAIPSPKQDEVLAAINDKKSVFIVVAKSLFADKASTVAACDSAVTLSGGKAVVVEVNLSDAKETAFLSILRVNTATTTTATIVANSKGQVTGTFYGTQKAATLVTLSNKVASGCCSPGVSSGSKSCAPKK